MTAFSPPRRVTDLIADWSSQQIRRAVVALAAVSAVAAWVIRFAQDDAFITYRFARNLARGNGLVLNPGERVEGYTNFLWTAMMAIPERYGWSAPDFSIYVGIATMVGAILVMFRFALTVLRDERLALLATVALVANMSFLAYGTGGLETMLQTLLVTGVGLLVVRSMPWSDTGPPERAALLRVAAGAVAGLACLTRLDSAVIVGVWFLLALAAARPGGVRSVAVAALQLGLPAAAVLTPWLVWKLDYYGELLPNTQAAKSTDLLTAVLYGVFYLLSFFVSYAAFGLIQRYRAFGREWFANERAKAASIVVGVWFLYICVVGADFMEYRFMVPVLPILAMFAAFLINRFGNVRRQIALVAVLLLVSAAHRVFPTIIPYPVLTLDELSHWPTDSRTSWKGMGEFLAEEFPGGPDVAGQPVIAVEPLGLISYYSDLPVIDMLGLADREIANDGDQISPYYPGHVRIGTVQQLLDKRATLIVGQPRIEDPGVFEEYRLTQLTAIYPTADLRELPESATVVEAPLVDAPGFAPKVWVMIYLGGNDKVDERIESGEWREVPIDRTCDDADLNVLTRMLAQQTCPDL